MHNKHYPFNTYIMLLCFLQYEDKIKLLKQKITGAKQQLHQNSRKKDNFQTKTVLQDSANDQIEQDLSNYRLEYVFEKVLLCISSCIHTERRSMLM